MENKYFSNAIFKNGWDGFDHIVLFENLSKKMACEIEIYLISKYKTTNQEYGYNLASGGEHPSPTKEIILKMSIPIVQLSLDGELINTYSGSKDAERKNNNFNSSAITFCCKGKQSKHKNYLFMYEIVCAVYGIVQNRIFTGFLKFWNAVKWCGINTVTNTQLTSN